MRGIGLGLALSVVLAACGGAERPLAPAAAPSATQSPVPSATAIASGPIATIAASVPPTSSPRPLTAEEQALLARKEVARTIDQVSPDKMWDHLNALTAVSSRDPRHPGHAKAQAYILEQLEALSYLGLKVETQRFAYQSVPLLNILAIVDPVGGASAQGGVIVGAHYDSIGKATPGWRPSIDPAPGADDNGTGTAALLEYARLIAGSRSSLTHRVVIAFWDGEEFFFKGSAAFVQALQKPFAYSAFVNIDMVGWNPIADRLDLIWYGKQSAALRDRAKAANASYAVGVSPLVDVFASDPNTYILDSAPFGLAGIPAITLAQRYGEADATFPGNTTFHTVNDTTDKITNRRLWLKAAKLTLAVVLELARQ